MNIRIAKTEQDMRAVWGLAHDGYVAKGYASPRPDRLLRSHPHLDFTAETTIWLAEDRSGNALGTLSYTLDGPNGLPLDKCYGDVVGDIRDACLQRNQRFGVCWRLITGSARQADYRITARLFEENIALARVEGVGVTLQMVNPRHAGFYQRGFGFKKIAGPVFNSDLNAYSVLLAGNMDRITKQWGRIRERRQSVRMPVAVS